MRTDSLKEARLKFMSQHAMGTSNSNGSTGNGTPGKKQPKKSANTLVGNHHKNKEQAASTPAPQPQKKTHVIRSKANRVAKNNMRESNALIPSLATAPKSKPMSRHLHTIIQHLLDRKFKGLGPILIEDLIRDTKIDMPPLDVSEMLSDNLKVKFDSGRYSYKGMYDITDKNGLLHLISQSPGGILLSNLKDCYAQVEADVKSLTAERKIFNIKNTDLGTEVLFFNNPNYTTNIDDEFKKMWHSIKIPDEIDLQNELLKLGIKSQADIDELNALSQTKKRKAAETKDKKAKKHRRAKVTNTHLVGSKIDITEEIDMN